MNNDFKWEEFDGKLYYPMCFEDGDVGLATHTLVAILQDLDVLSFTVDDSGEVWIVIPK